MHSGLRGWQNLNVHEKSTDLTKKPFDIVLQPFKVAFDVFLTSLLH